MLKRFVLTAFIATLFFTPMVSQARTLFSDSFDRSDNAENSLDETTQGMDATFPITEEQIYREEGSTKIKDGVVTTTTRNTMGQAGLLHDFTTAEFFTKNGKKHMRISLDVLALKTRKTGRYPDLKDQFAGFGTCFSLDGVAGLADVNKLDGGCRGAIQKDGFYKPTKGADGLFINYSVEDNIQVFHDGKLHKNVPFKHDLGTLVVDFYYTTIAPGQPVDYIIYDEETEVHKGTYTLVNTENYVVFGARAGMDYKMDNLLIETTADGSAMDESIVENIRKAELEKKAALATDVFIYDIKIITKAGKTTFGRFVEKDIDGNIKVEVFPGIHSTFYVADIASAEKVTLDHPENAGARAELRTMK